MWYLHKMSWFTKQIMWLSTQWSWLQPYAEELLWHQVETKQGTDLHKTQKEEARKSGGWKEVLQMDMIANLWTPLTSISDAFYKCILTTHGYIVVSINNTPRSSLDTKILGSICNNIHLHASEAPRARIAWFNIITCCCPTIKGFLTIKHISSSDDACIDSTTSFVFYGT